MTVPYGVFRRKILPNTSWSVRATWESSGLSSSSMLSRKRRPITCSRRSTGSEVHVAASFLQEEDRAPRAGVPIGNEHDVGGIDECWVLGAVDEPREVEVVVVRP